MSEPRFEIYEDAAGEWRWRLRAGNGELVGGSGEGFRDRTDARRAIQNHVDGVLAALDSVEVLPDRTGRPLVVEVDGST